MVTRILWVTFFVLVFIAHSSHAETQIFFGEDAGQGDTTPMPAHPNSDLAYGEFIDSIQEYYMEDFDSLASGVIPEFIVQFGAVDGLFSGHGQVKYDVGTFFGVQAISGSQFYLVDADTEPFSVTFDSPVEAIGFFATDLGDGSTQISVVLDGTREFIIPSCTGCSSGGVLFYGLIAEGEHFNSVTFRPDMNFSDGWGMDNLIVGWVNGVVPASVDSWGTIKALFR